MRERDLDTLELPLVLDAIAVHARSQAGQEEVRALRPKPRVEDAVARLDLLAEVLRRSAGQGAPPTADVVRLAPILTAAAPDGAALEARALAGVRDLLEVARNVRAWALGAGDGTPRLSAFAEDLGGARGVAGSLNRALDVRGLVRDDASPALERARAQLRDLRGQVEAKLLRLVRDPNLRNVIGDDYVTLRNGRFVVPVRASQPNAIPGVVQDRSGSDETIFVEPLFAVELNNRLLLAANAADVEERRVRAELTTSIRDESPILAAIEDTLATLDALAAAAAFAVAHRCTRPTIGGDLIELRAARHPLLLGAGRIAVPVDIALRADQRGLAVTGPNSGGKTVALKTLGLCVLMAQSGLYVPAADGSHLPFCAAVLADIGDEQSIARDLSTFTAHATNLAAIAHDTTAEALVLLDEPGAGTDPAEGAALAIGVLTDLLERGARVVFTTHFAHVKTFALSDARLEARQKMERIRNSFGSVVPADGGFLVPEMLRSQLLEVALESSVVRPRATVVPMESSRVPFPMIDSTSNQGSVFGGMIAFWGEESAALTDSSAKFGRTELDAKKLTGLSVVPNELLTDSLTSFSALIERLWPTALAFFEDIAYMTGSGAGEPLGFLGANNPAGVAIGAEVGQAASTLVLENVIKMYSRMLPSSLARGIWVTTPEALPELYTMALSVGTGGGPVMLTNVAGPAPLTIFGRPLVVCEKASRLGTRGDLAFVDLTYYLIGDRQIMSASSSTDYRFGNDQTAYRLIQRVDGRPWLSSPITPANGGPTLSPFVEIVSR